MTTATLAPPIKTVADLLERLGGVPANRVRFSPIPGTATEGDVLALDAHEDRLCELVDGVLVEKPMGFRESLLAGAILSALRSFVIPRNLGLVTGEAGMMKWFAGLVRIPDVAFISWDRLPDGRVPTEPIPAISPDLTVEVLSESNTKREMSRKRHEFFESGGRLVWEVDPTERIVTVYGAGEQCTVLAEDQVLSGGDVLPGFEMSLKTLFAELDRMV